MVQRPSQRAIGGQLRCRAAEKDEQNEKHRDDLLGPQARECTFSFTFIAAVRQLVSIDLDSHIFTGRARSPLADPQDLTDPADRASLAGVLTDAQAGQTVAELAELGIRSIRRRSIERAELPVLST